MKEFRLTIEQIKKICQENQYLLFRFSNGKQYGFNAKAFSLAMRRNKYKIHEKTDCIGFMPCDFQTYISNKVSFL